MASGKMIGKNAVGMLLVAALTASLFCIQATPVAAEGASGVTLLKNRDYVDSLTRGIRSARKSIIISSYIFKIGNKRGNRPGLVAEELAKARRRGVNVAVILEKSGRRKDSLNRENLHAAAILSRNGIKVYFDSTSVVTHIKAVVIDDRYVYLGSHNLTQAALTRNNELSLLVDSPELAKEVRNYLESL